MDDLNADKIVRELEAIKKLEILELLDKGYSQGQLAKVLGIGQATISRMFPGGVPKREKPKD